MRALERTQAHEAFRVTNVEDASRSTRARARKILWCVQFWKNFDGIVEDCAEHSNRRRGVVSGEGTQTLWEEAQMGPRSLARRTKLGESGRRTSERTRSRPGSGRPRRLRRRGSRAGGLRRRQRGFRGLRPRPGLPGARRRDGARPPGPRRPLEEAPPPSRCRPTAARPLPAIRPEDRGARPSRRPSERAGLPLPVRSNDRRSSRRATGRSVSPVPVRSDDRGPRLSRRPSVRAGRPSRRPSRLFAFARRSSPGGRRCGRAEAARSSFTSCSDSSRHMPRASRPRRSGP